MPRRRLLEDGSVRLLEDGTARLLEGVDIGVTVDEVRRLVGSLDGPVTNG